ncbi:hypothetical protein [Pseudomonas aeruginosa]|uniref:hypothetical protein n=1 Tax=Pseudomonas aeruginosa TaxID=287 RepID=UPI00053D13C3|nr:hypothetical protein [Pseudomonas aeruginosa]OFR50297.1 hypothetical protein HMPREF2886_11420 [Pseudomonas sp. HMSC066A08]MBN7865126.1 hypothetical protein [Pseudomonas aeruginosa]MCT2410993.1 hypothetical protein [Pseudomonas aeruginosa]MDI3798802.1 hypothetical protein [Pseudomonas aeruginosa]QTQ99672.1 hypothetical protein J9247_08920 [Pseudomonas aeruginosa]
MSVTFPYRALPVRRLGDCPENAGRAWGLAHLGVPMAGLACWGVTYQCSISFEGRAGLVVDYVTRGGQEILDAHSHCSRVFGTFE